jgi:hypothetical protein
MIFNWKLVVEKILAGGESREVFYDLSDTTDLKNIVDPGYKNFNKIGEI